MTTTTFSSLGLATHILSALETEGYETPTPIQAASIPALLQGRDLLGCAQTGTGKTAAFALPIIQRLAASRSRLVPRGCRALVVAPTRELAAQIDASFAVYGRGAGLSTACVFGGVGKSPQVKALGRGVDVLVATPGRLLDRHSEGQLRLDCAEIVVLDEADRMLDMGFIRDVRRIIALLPKKRQTLLFSA
ncbi:MAG: DEAD/DEAH box helicase, partial [Spirochaetaceae bacterium]|nr:DEAD/DEAH box helicase [Spirochaetaceae bacterium]